MRIPTGSTSQRCCGALFLRHFRPLVAHGHVHVAMPPLYRIDAGKQVHYALDDAERDQLLKKIEKRARAARRRLRASRAWAR